MNLYFSDSETVHRIHSKPLLIYVPIPDFSMPYNVLCLVCTVLAMGIGTILNLTTDQLVDADAAKPDTNLGKVVYFVKDSILMPIYNRIVSKFRRPVEASEPAVDTSQEPVDQANTSS